MLQSIRDNMKGVMAIFIVGIMIVPFALFGVDSLFLQDSTAGKAAEVNGEAITEQSLLQSIRLRKQQLLQQSTDTPPEFLTDERLRGPILKQLIQRELINQSAESGDMTVSDAELDQMILASPQFQRDGKFDPQLYTQVLAMQGYTPVKYKELLRDDIVVNQLVTGLTTSAFATYAEITALTALTQQKRDFQYLTLSFDKAAENIQIGDDQIQAYYEANQPEFMSREQVKVDFIELSLQSLTEAIDVADEDILAQYEQEMANFEAEVQRQVAHILIEPKDDGSDAALLDELQAKLAEGEEFAELAKQYSDDFGTKAMGGDFGFGFYPEEFNDVLEGMSVGDVSAPVTTMAGTHLVKLLAEEREEAPSFELRKDAIAENLALAAADSQYVEILDAIPDATYNADSLMDAAEELGLELQASDWISRDGGEGILANNQVLANVFSDELLREGHTSDVIELDESHVVVIKLNEYRPSDVKPLEQVSRRIANQLLRDTAEAQLAAQAQALIERLQTGEDIEQLGKELSAPWQVEQGALRTQPGLNPQLMAEVFQLTKPSSGPTFGGVQLMGGDYVLFQLDKVVKGELPDLPEEQLELIKQRMANQFVQVEFGLYQQATEQTADVEIY